MAEHTLHSIAFPVLDADQIAQVGELHDRRRQDITAMVKP